MKSLRTLCKLAVGIFPLIVAVHGGGEILADDLAILSDEFDDPATLANWTRLNDTEGWAADKLEVLDIDTTTPGAMRLMPHTTSWYMDLVGPLVYKEVTGDFAVTLHLDVSRRNAQPGRPTAAFSLGGIMIRTPRAVSAAGPNPDPLPDTELPWPPAGYATDWTPDGENYIFLSYGNPDGSTAPDQWAYEVKTTINGNSNLYYDSAGVPAGTGIVTLQAIRRGDTFVLMRKHEGGEWIIENRYSRPDMPDTLQVGITTYTDWGSLIAEGMYDGANDHSGQFHHNHNVMTAANGFAANPDLVVDAEYFRFARPPVGLTESDLQNLPLTSEGMGIQLLSATPLAGVLGDAIDQPYDPDAIVDLSIGRKIGGQAGEGVFNSTGAGQEVRLKARPGRRVRGFGFVRNDGTGEGAFELLATKKAKPFRVKWFLHGGGRHNVTAGITSLGATTESLVPGGSEMFELEGRTKRTPAKAARRLVRLTGTGTVNEDTVRGRLVGRAGG